MTNPSAGLLEQDDFLDLVSECVGKIVREQDFNKFLAWLTGELSDRFDASPPPDAEMLLMMACALGRQIWNATPLPSNRYRPQPVSAPGRNDRCLQGMPCKHKQCCGAMPAFPGIEADEIWMLLAERLGAQDLAHAVAEQRVPETALSAIAHRFLEEDDPAAVVEMLEALFSGSLERLDERYEDALLVLCDAYDALGDSQRKRMLLDRVGTRGRPALKASAWQRLASIAMDAGDVEESWRAFRKAQQARPDDPALAHLEIILLVSSQRVAEACSRASFWLHHLRRLDYDDPTLLKFLEQAQQEPEAALCDLQLGIVGEAALHFRELVGTLVDREIPTYRSLPGAEFQGDAGADPLDQIRESLRQIGMAKEAIEETARNMAQDLERERARGATSSGDGPESDKTGTAPLEQDAMPKFVLVAPAPLKQVERAWREVFQHQKPLSVSLDYTDGTDPWEDAEHWVEFLQRHHEAFDSLDILDDLSWTATALPGLDSAWLDRNVLAPLLDRAERIIDAACGDDAGTLPWSHPANRPPLRLLARRVFLHQRANDGMAARAGIRKMLALNPNDNHGMRDPLVNMLLEAGDNRGALQLAERYPDDAGVDICFGAALAHFRLGELDAARAVLKSALRFHPRVPEYLLKSNLPKPRIDYRGVTFGGEDEAWIYRDEMSKVWADTPSALEWLESEVPARRIAGGKKRGHRRR